LTELSLKYGQRVISSTAFCVVLVNSPFLLELGPPIDTDCRSCACLRLDEILCMI
jgi:hypothetical protein